MASVRDAQGGDRDEGFDAHEANEAADSFAPYVPTMAAIGRGRSLLQAVQIAFKGSSMPKADRADYVRDSFANWTALGWFYTT